MFVCGLTGTQPIFLTLKCTRVNGNCYKATHETTRLEADAFHVLNRNMPKLILMKHWINVMISAFYHGHP